jgi:translin
MTSDSPHTAERHPSVVSELVLGEIELRLRQRELRREEVHDRARRLRRMAQGLMTRMHEGAASASEVAELKRDLAGFATELREGLRDDAFLAQDALQECVEALLLEAVVRNAPLPSPTELGVPPEPYLLGLGDLVGEVRRLILRALSDGKLSRAEELLRLMEDLYHALMRFEAPRSIVAMKPKQDVARSLLEKTRGEVTLARLLARVHLPPTVPHEVEP